MRSDKKIRMHRLPDKPKKEFRPLDPDEAVLKLLHRSSADLSRQREVNFYLYFPMKEAATNARNELVSLGFTADCCKSEGGTKDWLLLATKQVIPRLADLTSIRKYLECLADKFGGVYDGWETELDADEGKGLPGI